MERSTLALVVFEVVGVGGLVCVGLVGLGGFCGEVFGRGLVVVI